MTKEELDKIIKNFELIVNGVTPEIEIVQFSSILGSKSLWEEIRRQRELAEQRSLKAINKYYNMCGQLMNNIILSMPDNLKEELFFRIVNSGYLSEFCNSEQKKQIEDAYNKRIEEIIQLPEEERIKAVLTVRKKETKKLIVKSLSDDRKIELLNKIDTFVEKLELVELITDDEKKVIQLKKFKEEVWPELENRFGDNFDLLISLSKKFDKAWFQAASTLNVKTLVNFSNEFDMNIRIRLLARIENEDVVLDELNKIDIECRDILIRIYQKYGNEILKNIDIRILDKVYLETLGEDKVCRLAYDVSAQKKLFSLSEKEYDVFIRCFNAYNLKLADFETDDWTTIANSLLNNLPNYKKLIESIENIEDVDIQKLAIIMQFPNYFQIETVEDVKFYENVKRNRLKEMLEKESLDESINLETLRNAVLLKLFGIDEEFASCLGRYDEVGSNEIQETVGHDFFIAIQEILKLTDKNILQQIYNECDDIGIVDIYLILREFKCEYAKKYNEGLYEPKLEDKIEEINLPIELRGLDLNIYDAGIDFNMIITSIGGIIDNEGTDNFEKDWNRKNLDSETFSTSYIKSEMIGVTTIPLFCYGFIQMKEDSLMYLAPNDLFSKTFGLGTKIRNEHVVYQGPNKLVNETKVFNELAYKRIQGNAKKQPDYIIAFKMNGKIENIDKIVKAAQDWGGKLPIVIVDVDRCLEAERVKILGDEQTERTISFI